jgi:radical SAM protein with 4Fe4S-binding SPASM domain
MARQLDRLTSTQSAMRQAGKELVIVTLGNLLSSEALAQFQQQCAKRDLPLTLFRATSRLGDAPIDALVHPDACPPSRRCERPFTKFYIRYNGDVVLCCEDWQYRTVLGNLTRDSITDVWQSAGYKSLRKGHLTGQTPFPCTLCDYVSD